MSRLYLFLLLSVLIAPKAFADGVYEIHGIDSERGEYSGQAWVHGSQAQRIIRWNTYRYAGSSFSIDSSKAVESVWSGSATNQELRFSLALSNVLTEFESFKPSDQELQTPISVTIPNPDTQSSFSFSVPGEGTYQETWLKTGEASPDPLWKNLRVTEDRTGADLPKIYNIAKWAGLDLVIDWYRAQPQTLPYRNREEFQKARQYLVSDRTDADFYASNPEILRITNKTLNPLSLAEASMRRNAYALKLFEKEAYLRKRTFDINLNSAGLLEFAEVNAQGDKVGKRIEYDSALWTGVLAWSEMLRYQVTRDPQAVANFRRILDGILALVEITGNQKTFARTLVISPPSENMGPEWIQGTGKYSHLKWRTGGNNDMVKGIFMTLTLAHSIVGPEETELRQRILSASRALLRMDAVSSRSFNKAIAHGLVALWSKDEDEFQSFSDGTWNLSTTLASALGLDGNVYYGGIADWSGIHLSMTSTLCQIALAKELKTEFQDSSRRSALTHIQKDGESQLLKMQKVYRKAPRQNYLTLIAYAFSPEARNDEALRNDAKASVWTLKEVPAPRSVGTATADLTKNAGWSLSSWPRVPWKALKGPRMLKKNLDFELFIEGAYSYPIFETTAWDSDYLWKDAPFSIKFQSDSKIQPFSSDYLMLYWAARASGLISEQD